MAKKKTVKSKKPRTEMREITKKETERKKKSKIFKELKKKIMEWGEKQTPVPNGIRRRPCGGCDVVL